MVFYDTGHFALETHAAEIGQEIATFLKTVTPTDGPRVLLKMYAPGLRIKDVELGITFDAVVTRTKKRAFFLVLSREPKDARTMSPPLKLAGQSWEDAMKKARTLLYMIRASTRYGRGFDDLGLPEDLSELEPEVPAFCFQGIVSALQSTANPPTAN